MAGSWCGYEGIHVAEGYCASCRRRRALRAQAHRGAYHLAKHYLLAVLYGILVAALSLIGVGLFAFWRMLAETGLVDGGPGLLCDTAMQDAYGHCHYVHHGWGYGPTTLCFGLVAWTIAAVVLVLCGKPGGDHG